MQILDYFTKIHDTEIIVLYNEKAGFDQLIIYGDNNHEQSIQSIPRRQIQSSYIQL